MTQIRVKRREPPTPGLGRVIADRPLPWQRGRLVWAGGPSGESADGCVHVTCDIAHSSTAPDDSSGRLAATASV